MRLQVILLDPTYDAYAPMAKRAGAVVVPVPLDEEDWSIPREGLEKAFSDKTKLILINTPHNPCGKVCCVSSYFTCCCEYAHQPNDMFTFWTNAQQSSIPMYGFQAHGCSSTHGILQCASFYIVRSTECMLLSCLNIGLSILAHRRGGQSEYSIVNYT